MASARPILVALVVGVHANCRVAHDGLGTSRRHRDPTVLLADNRITHVVQLAVLAVHDLFVAERRQGDGSQLTMRTPR